MAKVKYVAAGFLQDAEYLLEEFSRKNNKNFSAFADAWKKRGFSLIFMGRDDEDELREFTQEIFHVASKFITPSCPIHQIGGIYLLYALYRNQTLNPPVKIRLVLDQMDTISKLSNALSLENHKSFHYVVSYLVKNSLDFVACPRAMGPTMTAKLTEDWKRECNDNLFSLRVDLKKDMTELAASNVLKEIGELFAEYTETKKAINVPGIVGDVTGSLLEFTSLLESMLSTSVRTRKSTSAYVSSNIGSRRVDLKMKAFGIPACSNTKIESSMSNIDDESDDDLRIVTPKRRPLRRRGPRKVGRPKKVAEAMDESDDCLVPGLQKSFGKGNRRPRNTRYHYSKGEELKKISYYENLKFGSSSASCPLFSDSEVDDPEPSAGVGEETICSESSE